MADFVNAIHTLMAPFLYAFGWFYAREQAIPNPTGFDALLAYLGPTIVNLLWLTLIGLVAFPFALLFVLLGRTLFRIFFVDIRGMDYITFAATTASMTKTFRRNTKVAVRIAVLVDCYCILKMLFLVLSSNPPASYALACQDAVSHALWGAWYAVTVPVFELVHHVPPLPEPFESIVESLRWFSE